MESSLHYKPQKYENWNVNSSTVYKGKVLLFKLKRQEVQIKEH